MDDTGERVILVTGEIAALAVALPFTLHNVATERPSLDATGKR